MSIADSKHPAKYETLLAFLRGRNLFRVPCDVIRCCGPAAWTFAILRSSGKQGTFMSLAKLAAKVGQSRRTVIRHLDTLVTAGWTTKTPRNGHRTCTYTAREAIGDAQEYLLLTRWSGMTWGELVVMGMVTTQARKLLVAAADTYGEHGNDDEALGALDNLGGDERFRLSLRTIEETTGLAHHTILAAVERLHRRKLIIIRQDNDGSNLLIPNWSAKVRVSP